MKTPPAPAPKLLIRIAFLGLDRIMLEAGESLPTSCQGNSQHSPSRKSPFQPVESWSLHCKPISPGFQNNGQPLPARSNSHIGRVSLRPPDKANPALCFEWGVTGFPVWRVLGSSSAMRTQPRLSAGPQTTAARRPPCGEPRDPGG